MQIKELIAFDILIKLLCASVSVCACTGVLDVPVWVTYYLDEKLKLLDI